jgi:hypothetical protein
MYIGLQVKYPYCQILIKFEFSRHIFEKSSIRNFVKIRPVGAELFLCGQTDMTKLIVTFRNFANSPQMKRINGNCHVQRKLHNLCAVGGRQNHSKMLALSTKLHGITSTKVDIHIHTVNEGPRYLLRYNGYRTEESEIDSLRKQEIIFPSTAFIPALRHRAS